MTAVTIDGKQFEGILKKYPGVSRKELEEWIISKCRFYNSKKDLEKYGFEKGKKFEFNDKIKDDILLIDIDYKPIPTQAAIDRIREIKKMPKEEILKIIKKEKEPFSELREETLSFLLNHERQEAIEFVVTALYKHHKFYSIRDDKSQEVWIFNEGIYVPHGKCYIETFTRKVLIENYTSQFANQVIDRIRVDNFIDKEKFFENKFPNERVVENGILHVYTKTLTPFTPKKIFFEKLDFPYDPKAKCLKIETFFDETLGEQKKLIHEFGGDCLQGTYKYKKIVVQEGKKDSSKTTTQNALTRFFGNENVSSVPLNRLVNDNFSLGELHNQSLNTCGEITDTFVGNIDLLKLLTGEDFINYKRKFLSDLKFKNHAKLIFACNVLPIITADLAMWNRMIIFRYNTEFISEEEYDGLKEEERENKKIRDKDILDKICTKEEFSGLLNKFLEGLGRINKRGYSTNKTAEENKLYWIRKSDSLRAFCLDNIKEDVEGQINKKDFDKSYNKYCSKNKLKRLTKKHLRYVLETEYCVNDRQESDGERVWEGIKFKDLKGNQSKITDIT